VRGARHHGLIVVQVVVVVEGRRARGGARVVLRAVQGVGVVAVRGGVRRLRGERAHGVVHGAVLLGERAAVRVQAVRALVALAGALHPGGALLLGVLLVALLRMAVTVLVLTLSAVAGLVGVVPGDSGRRRGQALHRRRVVGSLVALPRGLLVRAVQLLVLLLLLHQQVLGDGVVLLLHVAARAVHLVGEHLTQLAVLHELDALLLLEVLLDGLVLLLHQQHGRRGRHVELVLHVARVRVHGVGRVVLLLLLLLFLEQRDDGHHAAAAVDDHAHRAGHHQHAQRQGQQLPQRQAGVAHGAVQAAAGEDLTLGRGRSGGRGHGHRGRDVPVGAPVREVDGAAQLVCERISIVQHRCNQDEVTAERGTHRSRTRRWPSSWR
jgi:hypothetical protein